MLLNIASACPKTKEDLANTQSAQRCRLGKTR
jgi:hypothetical protein